MDNEAQSNILTGTLPELVEALDRINSAAFAGHEDDMYRLIEQFNHTYKQWGLCTIRDNTAQCYTVALTKHISVTWL